MAGENPPRKDDGENPDAQSWDMDPSQQGDSAEAEDNSAEDAEKKECERLNKEIDNYFCAEIIRVGKAAGLNIENGMDTRDWTNPADLQKLLDALKANREKEAAAAKAESAKAAAVAATEGGKKTESEKAPEAAPAAEESSDSDGDDSHDAAIAAAAAAAAAGGSLADAVNAASEQAAGDNDPEATDGEEITNPEAEDDKSEKSKKRGRGVMGFFARHPKLAKAAKWATLGALGIGLFLGGARMHEMNENKWDKERAPITDEMNESFEYQEQMLGHYEVDYRADFANERGNDYNEKKGGPLDVTSPDRFTGIEDGDDEGFRTAFKEAYGNQAEAASALFEVLPEGMRGEAGLSDLDYDTLCDTVENDGDKYDAMQKQVGLFLNGAHFERVSLDGNHKVFYMRSATYPGEQITYQTTEGAYDTVDTTGKKIIAATMQDKTGDGLHTVYFLEECGNLIVDDVEGVKPIEETPDVVPEVPPEPDPEPDPQPDPEPDPEPDPQPDPEPDPQPDPEPDPQPDPEPDPQPDPEPDPQPDPQPDPEPGLDPKDEEAEYENADGDNQQPLGPGELTKPTQQEGDFNPDEGNFGYEVEPGTGDGDGDGVVDPTKEQTGAMDTGLESGDGSGRTIEQVVAEAERDGGANGKNTSGDESRDYVAPEVNGNTSAEEAERIAAEQEAARQAAEQAERDRKAAEEQARIDAERKAQQEAARQAEANRQQAAAQEEQDAADWAAGEFDLGGSN